MKRWILAAALLLAVGGLLYAGGQRITDVQSTVTLTLYNVDTIGYTDINKTLVTSEAGNTMYDFVRGYFYISEFIDPVGDTASGGSKDTVIITVKTGTGYDEDVLFCDTCADALPCTLFFDYYQGMTDGVDSVGDGVFYENSRKAGLSHNLLWFQYRAVDTNGTAMDTLIATINYWFRLIDKGEY